jgi:hypothetical protein
MINEKPFADFSSRVNLDSREQARNMRDEPRRYIELASVEPVGDFVAQNCVQTWIAKENFQAAFGGWVFPFYSLDLLAERHSYNSLLCQMRLAKLKMLHVRSGN